MQDNLPELRDIHIPLEVNWFPVAYGWWLLLLGGVALLFLVKSLLVLRRYSKKRYALKLLSRIDDESIITASRQMSEILRRICVYKYKSAASLSGGEWLSFLNSKSSKPLTSKAAELLLNAPYVPESSSTYSKKDAQDLRSFCLRWIGENL